MKYESAWVKRREDRAGKPFVGYLKYREGDKWKQVSKTLKTYVDPKTGEERPVKGARQAERALQQWRLEMEATGSVVSVKTYLSVYASRFLDALALKDDVRTVEHKRAIVKNHFGEFERVPLGKLTASAIQDWVLRLQADGLQERTVGKVFGVLRQTCRHAVKVGDLQANPCVGVILPSPPKPTPNAMEPAEIASLLDRLDAMGPTPLATAAYTALLCGCREGEICALTWADYDEDECTLDVSKSVAYDDGRGLRVKGPKTEAGVRSIPVPPRLAGMLARRKDLVSDMICETDADVDVEETYIIGGVDGSPSSPPSIGHQWARFAKKNALAGASGKRLKFHDLRDCYGTSLLGAGVDVTTAASLMGHGDGGATLLKYYSTALDSNKRLAAQKLSKALGDGSGD